MQTADKFEDEYQKHPFSNLATLSLSISKVIARLFKMPRKR
ncbi:MAG: hypothetical protein ACJAU6_002254 [Alphaproteobacteria bacterium]|jgi:hypothetical protein